MKSLFFSMVLLMSVTSFAGGVCKNNSSNPGMAGLCQMQGENGGKSMCQMTTGCKWISLTSNGVCLNNSSNPGMAGLCKMQGDGGGQPMCAMTTGCKWIDLD